MRGGERGREELFCKGCRVEWFGSGGTGRTWCKPTEDIAPCRQVPLDAAGRRFKQLLRLVPPPGGHQPAQIRGPHGGDLPSHHGPLHVCALRGRFGGRGVPGVGSDRGGEEGVGRGGREGECEVRAEGGEDGGEEAELGGGVQETAEEGGIRAGLLECGDDEGEDGVPDGAELGGVGGGGLVRVEGEPEEEVVGVGCAEGGGGGSEVLVAGLDVDGVGAELGVDGAGGVVLVADDEAVERVAELGLAGRGGGVREEGGPGDGGGGGVGGGGGGEGECGGGVLGGLVFEERGGGRGGQRGGGSCAGGGDGDRGHSRGDRGHSPGGGAPEAEDVESVGAHRGGEENLNAAAAFSSRSLTMAMSMGAAKRGKPRIVSALHASRPR